MFTLLLFMVDLIFNIIYPLFFSRVQFSEIVEQLLFINFFTVENLIVYHYLRVFSILQLL